MFVSLYYDDFQCELGKIFVVVDESGIRRVEVIEENWQNFIEKNIIEKNEAFCKEAIEQLKEYFEGKRKKFNLNFSIEGTDFRKKVWMELLNIPYGEVRSYKQIAEAIGNPKAVRAVGQANKVNPLPIFIPCHRVIGKDKSLVGYAGTRTDIKEKLLKIEGIIL
jgi:methylated-DNA-[protein]-cysteine S-methyltransferase